MTDPTPAAIPSRYVLDLRALGRDAHADARQTVLRLSDEVNLRQAPNVHRYELLAQQQHTALLAAIVANELEETATGPAYTALDAATALCAGYRMTHANGLHERGTTFLDRAIERVLDSVRTTQAQDEEEARHEAEQDRAIAEHESDLAQRDLL
jgi:hypothetical protein